MRHTLLLPALLAAACSASAATDSSFRWTGTLAPGQTVSVFGVNGNVRAEAATGNNIEVTAVKSATRSDVSSVRVEVVPHAGGVTLCAIYPDQDGERNECRPDGARNKTRDNDVKVDFTVRVPAGVRLKAKTVNGGVTANDLRSEVEAGTVNGNVEVSTTEGAEAKTVNGSIHATMGRAQWEGSREFNTVNGSITLRVPSALSTDFQANTVNGNIETDFPITMQGTISKRRVKGVIGGGGRALEMKTVNGSIRLLRAG